MHCSEGWRLQDVKITGNRRAMPNFRLLNSKHLLNYQQKMRKSEYG
jgi:hypothetical protein